MPRRQPPEAEDLRSEYAAAEVHVATLSSGLFQSAAIVVGGSIAAFGLLIDATFTYSVAAVVTVLALGAILVIEMWRHNWRRHKVSIDNHWVRMREIEKERGMWTNIYLYLLTKGRHEMTRLDEWRWLSIAEQARLHETYSEFPEPPGTRIVNWLKPGRIRKWLSNVLLKPTGQDVLQATACLAEVGWLVMIAFAWIEAVRNQGAAPGCLGWATW